MRAVSPGVSQGYSTFPTLVAFFLRTRMTFSGIHLCLPCVTFHWLSRSYFMGVLRRGRLGGISDQCFAKEVGRTLLLWWSGHHQPHCRCTETEDGAPMGKSDWLLLPWPSVCNPHLYSPLSKLSDGVGTTVWLRWQSRCCKHRNQEPIQMDQESPGSVGIVLKVSVATFLNTEEEGFAVIWRNATISSLLEWEPEKIKTFVDCSENVGF